MHVRGMSERSRPLNGGKSYSVSRDGTQRASRGLSIQPNASGSSCNTKIPRPSEGGMLRSSGAWELSFVEDAVSAVSAVSELCCASG